MPPTRRRRAAEPPSLSLADAGIALDASFGSAIAARSDPWKARERSEAGRWDTERSEGVLNGLRGEAEGGLNGLRGEAEGGCPSGANSFGIGVSDPVRTPERIPKAPNAAMRAAGRAAGGEASVVVSPEGLFPRACYETEIWYHMAAICELLRAAEYPEGRVGIGAGTPYCIRRGPTYSPPPPEQAERMRAAGRRWAERWVRGRVGARLADGVRAFAADEEAQLWAHGWMRSRKGVSIHYRNWGAMTLGLLLGVEPGVLRWVGDLYGVFLGPRRQLEEETAAGGGDPARLALQLEGFTWCPRLATHERFAQPMRAAPAGTPAPRSFDPMDTRFLATSYRIQERLAYEPDRHAYGSLEPGRAQPTTHLEFAANLARHDQRAEQGDVQLVYSRDSHTLSCAARLERLLHFARHPPDLAEIERRCFGVEPRDDGVQRVWCAVSEAAVAAACRPMARETPGHNLGTELTQSLGVALRRAGRHRTFNPSTSPLWVGPACRAELPAGRILGWPANLVHGWPNTNGLSSAYHLTKTLCFASSFQQDGKLRRHPQEAVWRHCWGIRDWAEVLGPTPPVRALIGRAVPQPRNVRSLPIVRAKRARAEAAESAAENAAENAAEGAAEGAASPHVPETPPAARKRTARGRKVHALGDVEAAAGSTAGEEEDLLLLRTAADLTHHATRLDSYSNLQAFAFMFKFVPETRTFFSLPHQLARALILRFPETYPPDTTDPLALARRLLRERVNFEAPAEVQRMLRTLWDMFAPS